MRKFILLLMMIISYSSYSQEYVTAEMLFQKNDYIMESDSIVYNGIEQYYYSLFLVRNDTIYYVGTPTHKDKMGEAETEVFHEKFKVLSVDVKEGVISYFTKSIDSERPCVFEIGTINNNTYIRATKEKMLVLFRVNMFYLKKEDKE